MSYYDNSDPRHLKPDCFGVIARHYDPWAEVTIHSCTSCGYCEHPPLKFKEVGYIGAWRRYPLFEGDPSPIYYANAVDYWDAQDRRENPQPEKPPVLKPPVRLVFDPWQSVWSNDGKEHEGVSFADLWADRIARTIWLGYRGFMLTSQNFRGGCMSQAAWLRKKPGKLLGEYVNLCPERCNIFGQPWESAIGAQLVPYLIYELCEEGRWPYFGLGGIGPLTWVQVERRAA